MEQFQARADARWRIHFKEITNYSAVPTGYAVAFHYSLSIDARRWRADLASPSGPMQLVDRFHRRAFATTADNR